MLARRVSETEMAAQQATRRFEEMAKSWARSGLASQLGSGSARVRRLPVFTSTRYECDKLSDFSSNIRTPRDSPMFRLLRLGRCIGGSASMSGDTSDEFQNELVELFVQEAHEWLQNIHVALDEIQQGPPPERSRRRLLR